MAPTELPQRYNISPSQQVLCDRPEKKLSLLRWKLIRYLTAASGFYKLEAEELW